MKSKKVLPLGLIFIFLGLVLFYVLMSARYQNVFLPNTTYSGVNISGKTPEQAEALLKQHLKDQTYKVVENHKRILSFTGKNLDLTDNYTKPLASLKDQQNPWAWTLTAFAAPSTTTNNSGNKLTVNQQKAEQLYQKILVQTNDTRKMTQDATIVKSGDTFTIQKETYGNNIDTTKLKTVVNTAITQGKTNIDLSQAYAKPTITSDDANLKKSLAQIKTIAAENITYEIFGYNESVPRSDLFKWVSYRDGKIQLDQAAMTQFITELSAKYSTIHKSHQFKTQSGSTIESPAGTYGWSVNVPSELKQLNTNILQGKSFVEKPVTQGFGYNENKVDIGNTYVEVSKSQQHMWVVINGKVQISTDVVTGKPGQDTPSGTFVVWNKVRDTSLKGKNDDGSDYSSPVAYWMPVDYTGVGIHDSLWQPYYGGDWYKENGSHGCVNTPPSTMAKVYATVPVNTPVIIY